ncbi:MAG TPA: glutaredoxin family protein [Pyrinomonadaceae bacterium]
MKSATPKQQYNVDGGLFIPNFTNHWQDPLTGFAYKSDALSSSGGTVLTAKPHVTIYSRPGCHLCEEAKAVIEAACSGDEFTLEEVNIESDPELLNRYQYDVPVIAINGVDTFMHRVDPDEFKAAISKLRGSRPQIYTNNPDRTKNRQ